MSRESEIEIVKRHMATPPVDVAALIEELGVRYVTADLRPGESGRIEKTGDQYRIVVNANEGIQRRRFTAAHELAHYLLHRDLLDEHGHLDRLYDFSSEFDENPSTPFSPSHEVQANKLAAQILMPAGKVKARHRDIKASNLLAQEFGVSPAAMRVRLSSLGLKEAS